MELAAAINGLLVLTEKCRVTVITDSKYLQQGITVYLVRWQSRGWCNSRGEAIANRDLWERLASVASRHETTWRWVRSHGCDPDQDRCDVLAKESARTVNDGRDGRGTGRPTPYPLYMRAGIAPLDLKL
jgi:ribonuclease HI